jgi:exoribonuclease II
MEHNRPTSEVPWCRPLQDYSDAIDETRLELKVLMAEKNPEDPEEKEKLEIAKYRLEKKIHSLEAEQMQLLHKSRGFSLF